MLWFDGCGLTVEGDDCSPNSARIPLNEEEPLPGAPVEALDYPYDLDTVALGDISDRRFSPGPGDHLYRFLGPRLVAHEKVRGAHVRLFYAG